MCEALIGLWVVAVGTSPEAGRLFFSLALLSKSRQEMRPLTLTMRLYVSGSMPCRRLWQPNGMCYKLFGACNLFYVASPKCFIWIPNEGRLRPLIKSLLQVIQAPPPVFSLPFHLSLSSFPTISAHTPDIALWMNIVLGSLNLP